MTPRQIGEIVGFLLGTFLVVAIVGLIIATIVVLVARLRGRRITLGHALRTPWLLGVLAVVSILLILSALGGR